MRNYWEMQQNAQVHSGVSAREFFARAWARMVNSAAKNENGLKIRVRLPFGQARWHAGSGSMGGQWSSGRLHMA